MQQYILARRDKLNHEMYRLAARSQCRLEHARSLPLLTPCQLRIPPS